IEWKNGKLLKAAIRSGSGGYCRIQSLQRVKVMEVAAKDASGVNPNVLNTAYGKPPYQKNATARLVEINEGKEYGIDFNTEKGKTYTIVPI
ncbi:MAG: glycoside hydrolase family 95 protein, partial [Bacteroidetes bacterium]|nr:glycoside hydrolase family 95 protein [Bacteroidota bacterium]